MSTQTQIDVLLITAVEKELNEILDLELDWQPKEDSKGFSYYIRKDIDKTGNEFSIALARPNEMGGDFKSNHATRLVNELKPFCLAMAGICAGWRDEVFLGDVIIAERVFGYDVGKLKAFLEGKVRTEQVFHDIRTYNLKPLWVLKAHDFPSDWINKIKKNPRPKSYDYQELWLLYRLDESEILSREYPLELEKEERKKHCPDWAKVLKRLEKKELIKINEKLELTDKGKKFISQVKIRNPDGIPKDPDEPKSHVAPMGTGSKVVEDPELFPTISRYMRKVRAVEMEATAIGTIAEIENVDSCIIVKGVSDYGDLDKNDYFRCYAIEASYRFLMEFLKENLQKNKKHVPFILPIKDAESKDIILSKKQSDDSDLEGQLTFEYDIALSFAGEHRGIAESIAQELKKCGVSLFYDNFEQSKLWGKRLSKHFQQIYGPKTRFVVVFISKEYPIKDWTDFEFTIAREEAKNRKSEFILPVRIDETHIFGLPSDIAYLDLSKVGIKGVVDNILVKLSSSL